VANLKQLVRYLRNAIAHFNVRFEADNTGQIAGLIVWNSNRGRTTWRARLTISELEGIALQFVALLLNESPLSRRFAFPRP
jgi:hypothetical protein